MICNEESTFLKGEFWCVMTYDAIINQNSREMHVLVQADFGIICILFLWEFKSPTGNGK